MTQDTIIEQLHQVREQLAQEFNFDVFAIVADARAQQAQNNHPVVSFVQTGAQTAAQPQATTATPAVVESEPMRRAA